MFQSTHDKKSFISEILVSSLVILDILQTSPVKCSGTIGNLTAWLQHQFFFFQFLNQKTGRK